MNKALRRGRVCSNEALHAAAVLDETTEVDLQFRACHNAVATASDQTRNLSSCTRRPCHDF